MPRSLAQRITKSIVQRIEQTMAGRASSDGMGLTVVKHEDSTGGVPRFAPHSCVRLTVAHVRAGRGKVKFGVIKKGGGIRKKTMKQGKKGGR